MIELLTRLHIVANTLQCLGSMDKVAIIRKCRKSDIDPSRPKKDQVWCLFSKSTGRLLGRHPTKESAREQERAIYANK